MASVTLNLERLAAATGELLGEISGLGEADVREPSLLPGWTRGHVLSHLARNAEGGTRLLGWARTGIPRCEYESLAGRAADIDAGAARPAEVLISDVRATAAAFASAAAAVPAAHWQRLVTYTTGHEVPAGIIVSSRLQEVLIHHVDLALGYGPDSWPGWFTAESAAIVTESLTDRGLAPLAARLHATDTGHDYRLGAETSEAETVRGPRRTCSRGCWAGRTARGWCARIPGPTGPPVVPIPPGRPGPGDRCRRCRVFIWPNARTDHHRRPNRHRRAARHPRPRGDARHRPQVPAPERRSAPAGGGGDGPGGSLHTVALVPHTRSKGHVCWWSIRSVRSTRPYCSLVPAGSQRPSTVSATACAWCYPRIT